LYALLERVQERSPRAFDRHFRETLPRLRALRRVFDTDPDLGNIIVQHSRNHMAIRRGARAWRHADAAERERIKREWRRRLAVNMRLEAQATTRRIRQLEDNREQLVAESLTNLASGEADLAAETPDVRELVLSLQAAADETERQACEKQLRAIVTRRLDEEIATLRERVANLTENAAEEVDRRLQHFIERAERQRRPPPHDERR
jgi:hypothetical protein